MSRFRNAQTGVVVSVDDSKDDRFASELWLSGEDVDQPDDAQGSYKGVRVADLKAEIARRNEGREDDAKVSAEGKRADLVAALEADDAKSAASSDN